jgi:hypothetical protein
MVAALAWDRSCYHTSLEAVVEEKVARVEALEE